MASSSSVLSSSLDQFVAHVHEVATASPDAVASHFRRSKKQLLQAHPPVVCRAAATVDPANQAAGHGCILYATHFVQDQVTALITNTNSLSLS